jgi:hypothetical protein
MRPLAPAETHTVDLDPRSPFHPSGIEISPGARYQFRATGKWKDGWIICGPQGWQGLILNAGNRLPWRRFFLLCGAVGQDLGQAFSIGAELDWSAPSAIADLPDRQLYFFANDWPSRYRNNESLPPEQGGPLRVTVTRLS